MRVRGGRSEAAVAVLLCAAAVWLHFAPEVRESIRTSVRDTLRPGQLLVRRAEAWAGELSRSPAATAAIAQIAALERENSAWRSRCRNLEIANARLRDQVAAPEHARPLPYSVNDGAPLLVPDLVRATVLGKEAATLLRGGKLIDFGSSRALTESVFVLEGSRPLIDQGQDAGLDGGHAVYSGRAVAGRLANVGRWVSTLQHVTDPEYRGFAQIARTTEGGLVFGPRGILAGCGEPLCRLSEISSTESVTVADEVYTADATFPEPMYYGRVVHAELAPGGLRWDVRVEPAVPLEDLKHVQVLRQVVNPVRVLGH